ncbi:MAG: excinuclease ABC subunit UvrC [Actinomycetota bacterium]|nr:excinuclease ABC subunit UvrC [Actinomycetota bacterium]
MTSQKALLEQLKMVPDKSGVYVFKDAQGKVLYIGKGRSLRKRMRSYFQKIHTYSPKIQAMVDRIADFDIYVTDSEVEALILECNLIKRYRPSFNINLRDDKSYPCLAITLNDAFPRVMVTRKLGIEGAKYFGPYTKAHAIRDTLDTLRRIFPVRACKGKEPGKSSGSPCLNFHIKRCLGPCTGKVSREEYRKMIDQICLFLEGKQEQVIEQLQREMKEAAEKLEFEKAARLRNRIRAAQHVLERQRIISSTKEDKDVIALFAREDAACVEVFFIRGGKLIGSESFILDKDEHVSEKELLTSFVKQFYLTTTFVPRYILLQDEIEDAELIEEWLTKKRGKKVEIKVPKRGEKRSLVALAIDNARHAFELLKIKRRLEKERALKALAELKEQLDLSEFPYRIECFDISTIRGRQSVGSMVVFENGRPKNKDYRKFKIKWVTGQDDFAMMAEVIKRRFARYLEGKEGRFGIKPDLVIVDGGKPQLSAALKSLTELGIEDIPVIALAKREEEIYLPNRPEPISLLAFSLSLRLIQRIRDEAHRFALSYHRSLREKAMVKSIFDRIPGIGEKRKKFLLEHFGSPEAIYKASLEELKTVPKLPSKVAHVVYRFLHH